MKSKIKLVKTEGSEPYSVVMVIDSGLIDPYFVPLSHDLCGLRGCKNRPAPFPGRMS